MREVPRDVWCEDLCMIVIQFCVLQEAAHDKMHPFTVMHPFTRRESMAWSRGFAHGKQGIPYVNFNIDTG